MSEIRLKTSYEAATVMSAAPVIATRESIISSIEAEYLINKAKPLMKRAGVVLDEGYNTVEGRSGSNCWLRFDEDEVVAAIGQRIADIIGLPLETSESLQVIHYGVSQEYRPHFDAFDLHTTKGLRAAKWGGQRLVTALVYLNDVGEGGGTSFPKLNLEVEAKRGRLVIFHNVQEQIDKPHPSSLHGGMPVMEGEKWAFNMWFRHQPTRNEFSADGLDSLPAMVFEGQHTPSALAGVPAHADREVAKVMPAPVPGVAPEARRLSERLPLKQQQTRFEVVSNRCSAVWQRAGDLLNESGASSDRTTRVVYWDTFDGTTAPAAEASAADAEFSLVARSELRAVGDLILFKARLDEFGLGDLAVPTLNSTAQLHDTDLSGGKWVFRRRAGFSDNSAFLVESSVQERLHSGGLQLTTGDVLQRYPDDAISKSGNAIKVRLHLLLAHGRVLLFDEVLTSTEHFSLNDSSAAAAREVGYLSKSKLYEKSIELVRIISPALARLAVACQGGDFAILAVDAVVSNAAGLKLIGVNGLPSLSHDRAVDERVMVPLLGCVMEFLVSRSATPRGFVSGCFAP